MVRITLLKSLNVRNGEVPLKFRLKDGRDVDLVINSGLMIEAHELMNFNPGGSRRSGESDSAVLKDEIDRYLNAMGLVYAEMSQESRPIDAGSFQRMVDFKLGKVQCDQEGKLSLLKEFRAYVEVERETGAICRTKYRAAITLSNKLERYLKVREFEGILSVEFSPEMVADFEKFCMDEYLYAVNPKYSYLYPRDYDGSRLWPKHKLSESTLKKMLYVFRRFWDTKVLSGELESSPYNNYQPWMQEVKNKSYREIMGEPLSLTIDEFTNVMTTPLPASIGYLRNVFVLHCCLGCSCELFKSLTMKDLKVTSGGIPYIQHRYIGPGTSGKTDFVVPLVRVAFDIVLRSNLEFNFDSNAVYVRRIRELLRILGITREVCVYNERTHMTEVHPICDVFSLPSIKSTHLDIIGRCLYESEMRREWTVNDRQLLKRLKGNIVGHFNRLSKAFNQSKFRVSSNLSITEGAPFIEFDELIYTEQPDKLLGGRTNPYVISQLIPFSSVEGHPSERIEVRYGPSLQRARKIVVYGTQVYEFLESLEVNRRQLLQYGYLLLKILSDFNVMFVNNIQDGIYELKTLFKRCMYSTYFYLNNGTVVLLYCCLSNNKSRGLKSVSDNIASVFDMRNKYLAGEGVTEDYDIVLDSIFGSAGSAKCEIMEMRACCSYASQVLRNARVAAGLQRGDVLARLGFSEVSSNLVKAETGVRVLPYKYLEHLLEALGLKAIIVRPGLDGWNSISRKRHLEDMLAEIGELGNGYVHMRQCDKNDMETKPDVFLGAVEDEATPGVLSEPNDATIKAINELENGQTTHCSSYEDYISKI